MRKSIQINVLNKRKGIFLKLNVTLSLNAVVAKIKERNFYDLIQVT